MVMARVYRWSRISFSLGADCLHLGYKLLAARASAFAMRFYTGSWVFAIRPGILEV
jgi:hypothetical protein